MAKLSASCLALLAFSLPAATIVSVSGTPTDELILEAIPPQSGGQIITTWWTQSDAFAGIAIGAVLGDGTDTVTAYLTTTIGPGTTALLATGTVTTPPVSNPTGMIGPVHMTLLSGLDLGPGTYYLTLSSSNAEWFASSAPLINTAPGVTYGGDSAIWMTGTIDSAFPPASSGWRGPIPAVQFDVTQVPEPSLYWIVAFCAAAIIKLNRHPE